MAEYIERDIFINNKLIPLVKQLDLCHPKQKKGVLMAIRELNNEPTADVVEVVRCKNCVQYIERELDPPFCCRRRMWVKPTDFCSYGERSTDNA